jgi:hypothetical protein
LAGDVKRAWRQANVQAQDSTAKTAERSARLYRKICERLKKACLDADRLSVVKSELLLDFGLQKKDTIRTEAPLTLEGGEYLQIIVKHSTRPPRYNGVVAFYKVGGSVPETYKELTSSRLLARPRENEKDRLGPPPPIQARMVA